MPSRTLKPDGYEELGVAADAGTATSMVSAVRAVSVLRSDQATERQHGG
jgi:hypothetical protein